MRWWWWCGDGGGGVAIVAAILTRGGVVVHGAYCSARCMATVLMVRTFPALLQIAVLTCLHRLAVADWRCETEPGRQTKGNCCYCWSVVILLQLLLLLLPLLLSCYVVAVIAVTDCCHNFYCCH